MNARMVNSTSAAARFIPTPATIILILTQRFAAPKLPQEVSPNDHVKSNLIEDADAIITKNMIPKTAIANVVDLRDLVQSDSMRTSWLPYITEFKAFGKQADHVLRKTLKRRSFHAVPPIGWAGIASQRQFFRPVGMFRAGKLGC